jgi:formate dehydrogenase subunit gamma
MSAAIPHRPLDTAIVTAREREDVVVGNEIVRHRRASRLIHWSVALTFFVSLFTGMPIWSPVFGWMAHLFGGLSVCRVLHPWVGVAFFLTSAVMFFHWLSDMHLEPRDREWIGPRALQYMRYETDDSEVGKYNGGQKLFFWATALGAVGLLLSGLLIWFPRAFPRLLLEFSYVIHDVTFILFTVAIVFHIYLGSAAEPGTFGSMTRGTVTRAWARLHHPRWYREVTGEEARRR